MLKASGTVSGAFFMGKNTMGEIDVKKIIEETADGNIYRDEVAQVNLDGSPITDKRYIRLPGDHFGIIHHGDKIKEVDHQPTPEDLKIANLVGNSETVRKGHIKRKARKTAQESLEFLLSCMAEPKEAREVIHAVTGGEMSDTLKNFFEVKDGDESDLTQYDLINLAMVAQAKLGDTKAAAYVRDTIGDKLAEKQEINATFTDGDRSLLEKVSARMQASGDGSEASE